MSDWRYALRTLRRTPGFAIVAVLSLSLGIGANAAIYSVIRLVLLDPLPVQAPDELVAAGWSSGTGSTRGILNINSTSYRDDRSGRSYGSNFSYALYRALRDAGGPAVFGFSYAASDASVSLGGQPFVASSLLVSGNFFSTLGVPTALGRPLGEADDHPDAAPVAVLTDSCWRRQFGGDPGVLGRTIRVNGGAFTIVGITRPGFYGVSKGGPFFKPSDLLLPLAVEPLVYTRSTPRSLFDADDRFWVLVMARVPPGAPTARLEAALNAAFHRGLAASLVPAVQGARMGDLGLVPAPRGLDSWSRNLRQPLMILSAVVGIVLLIACVNLGNLMLVRAAARQRELSIQLALGAGRWRVARGIVVEGAVLAGAGGALGILVAVWGVRALLATMIAGSARTAIEGDLDGRLVGATAMTSVVAIVLFSALPALRTARSQIAPLLSQVASRGSVAGLRAGRVLMAVQVAISVPLLVAAVLFLRTIYNLGHVDLGFNPDRLVMFHVDPSLNAYDGDRIERLYSRIVQRLDAMPGVETATVTDIVPLSRMQNNWGFLVPGSAPKNVHFVRIGPAYFQTFATPLVAGRGIGVQDDSRAPRVAVVNAMAAETLFGDGTVLGRHLAMQSDPPAEFEVVGVVQNSRYTSPRDPDPATVYLPYAQTTLGRLGPMNVAVRSSVPAGALEGLVKAAMAEVDPDVPVTDLRTEVSQIDETLGTERTFLRLLLAFGAFALLLAGIGLHGITAYAVVRRTKEFGVRVALGAQRADVLWLVLRQVAVVTLIGLAVGIPAAIGATQLVRASLYGVDPTDPISLVGAMVVMLVVAAAAGLIPARRAAGLDPLTTLRYD